MVHILIDIIGHLQCFTPFQIFANLWVKVVTLLNYIGIEIIVQFFLRSKLVKDYLLTQDLFGARTTIQSDSDGVIFFVIFLNKILHYIVIRPQMSQSAIRPAILFKVSLKIAVADTLLDNL